jgi:CDP-ribitol ribitolphosphotransferase / teichoic acid ribitol-phosphate polymerase
MDDRITEPAIDIQAIRWERINLVIEARVVAGGAGDHLDPPSLRLVHAEGDGELPLTHASAVDGCLTLRINVMQGPDLQPLTPGHWRLVGGRASVGVRVADPGRLASPALAVSFRVRRGLFSARPMLDHTGHLVLDIGFERRAGFDHRGGLVRRLRTRATHPFGALRGAILRGLVRVFKTIPGESGPRVLFSSETGASLDGNLKAVHDRMVERGLGRRYHLDTLVRGGAARRRTLSDRFRLPWRLAAADVIVIDDFQAVIHRFGDHPGVRIVQLWHAAGAFKTVGYSRVGKPGGPDPYSRVHKNYTHAIVSSEHDVPFYAEAFGIPEARVVPTGIPRMDRFFDPAAADAGLRAAHAAFPASVGRFTILFAPTFRGETSRDASYDLSRIDYAALHALCVEKDAVVIIRMHPFISEPLGIPAAFADRLLDGSTTTLDVNDLLFAVDLLITDYSSIVFEFSRLGRPMLFYAWDLEAYIAERDFYEPFETFVPGRIVSSFPELLDAIQRDEYEADKVADFAARHFAHLDGGASDRVIDELILGGLA